YLYIYVMLGNIDKIQWLEEKEDNGSLINVYEIFCSNFFRKKSMIVGHIRNISDKKIHKEQVERVLKHSYYHNNHCCRAFVRANSINEFSLHKFYSFGIVESVTLSVINLYEFRVTR